LVAAVLTSAFTASATAQTAVKVTMEGRNEGPLAPFFVALDGGHFRSEGLEVTMEPAPAGSDPIARVASGAADIGYGDFNALIRWRDQNPTVPLKAVCIVFNKPTYAIVGRKSRGIVTPKDLEEKRLGAPIAEPSTAQWPLFAKINGIDLSKVVVVNVGVPVREPMLAAGEVDAITGASFSSPISVREKGVPAEDVTVLLMADWGLDLYGSAIFVAPKFAAEKPEAVRGFIRGLISGMKETLRDPGAAIATVVRRNGGVNRDVELERLLIALNQHVLTPEVKAKGFGDVDAERLDHALEQIGQAYAYKAKPKAADLFDSSFLPPPAERKLH
jgi:NitT/TauT family transport system substrate-binding protein